MPNITVSSTTDSPDDVLAATGAGLPPEKKVVEPTPAPAAKASETPEASDATDETDESKSNDDSGESNDEEKETELKPKKRGGFKKRIDKLNTRLSAKEQEVEYWKLEALKNKRADEPVDKSKAKDTEPEGKPKSEDFESHEAYIEAVTDWKVEKKLSEKDRKTEEQALKAEMKSQEDQYRDKLVEFKKDHTDYDELMEDIDDIPMSFTVRNVLLDSDNGPELAYALAKNRDEYDRICKLPAIAAARELGRFEARLNQESSKEQKKINKTNAPPPVKTVGSKGSGTSKKSPEDMDYDEYKKWRATGMSS